MTIRKLNDSQIEELIRLREKGWSHDRLATHLGVSAAAVHYQCLKHGVISPHQRNGARGVRPQGPQSFVASDGRTQRRFTPDEDARLLDMRIDGMGYRAISRSIGRPFTSVRIRLMMLALHDEIEAG